MPTRNDNAPPSSTEDPNSPPSLCPLRSRDCRTAIPHPRQSGLIRFDPLGFTPRRTLLYMVSRPLTLSPIHALTPGSSTRRQPEFRRSNHTRNGLIRFDPLGFGRIRSERAASTRRGPKRSDYPPSLCPLRFPRLPDGHSSSASIWFDLV
jgi:hypothetical protein